MGSTKILKRWQDRPLLNNINLETFKIVEIMLRIISPIEAKTPFYDATMGPFLTYEYCFLTIKDDEGFTGEGEFPLSAGHLLKKTFVPILLDSPKMKYSKLFETLFWNIRNEGFRGASAQALGHLDKIFYDLASKRKNMPVHAYLGSGRDNVKAYASGGGLNLKGTALIDECLQWEEQGYETVKIKFGGLKTSVQEDIKRIAAVRDALHSNTRLAVDANQFMNLERAKQLSVELQDMDIAWLEEPLHSASLEEIGSLCSHTKLNIAYGESERSSKVFPSIIRAGVKHLQPIAGHISSIIDWLGIYEVAKNKGLEFTSGGNSYFNCQFVSAAGELALMEFLEPVLKPMEEIILYGPKIENGYFFFSEAPGVGASIDWDKLRSQKRISDKKVWST